MKFALSILLTFVALIALGQSKKLQIEELQTKLNRSQLNERSLEEDIKQLNDTLLKFENDKNLLENGISYLENLNSENEKKKNTYAVQLNKIQEESASYAAQLYTIQEELKSKKDSIKYLLLELNSITSDNLDSEINNPKSKLNPNDFLNNYVVNRKPLNNNTFSFQLVKVLTYRGEVYNRNYSAPSIIDADNFYFQYIPEGKNINKVTEQALISQKPISFFGSLMPQVEVLKNKLVTIKYNDGSEESLLYNFKSEKNSLNENLRITLASEEVNNSYNDNKGDITWKICQINGEHYISLSYQELQRLKVPLDEELEKVNYVSNDVTYQKSCQIDHLPYAYGKDYINLTVEKIWLTQKKNRFVEKDTKINPNKCRYLFKLI
tara:strand:+ start:3927 stop:5066 length:1140 start_codon:yes stop_codon:yes gene_type:complete